MMISTTKQTTVYIQFLEDDLLAFPDLDQISKQLIPLYDFEEFLYINEE